VTTFETLDDGPRAPGTPRRYGCLIFPSGVLDGLPGDFARTAEPWVGHHRPAWAASGRVREWMEARRVRGWEFRPLLVEGTPMELEHRRRWDGLLASLGDAGARLRV